MKTDSSRTTPSRERRVLSLSLGSRSLLIQLLSNVATLPRTEAIKRSLLHLRFFHDGPQSGGLQEISHKGFYYHFLDMKTGRRVWKSEVSTIDTTYLLAGALTSAMYFDRDTKEEREIRTLAEALYARADWQWAQNGGLTVTHGWKPERGFIKYRGPDTAKQ